MDKYLIRASSLNPHLDPDMIYTAIADIEAMIGDTTAFRRLCITAALATARAAANNEGPLSYSASTQHTTGEKPVGRK